MIYEDLFVGSRVDYIGGDSHLRNLYYSPLHNKPRSAVGPEPLPQAAHLHLHRDARGAGALLLSPPTEGHGVLRTGQRVLGDPPAAGPVPVRPRLAEDEVIQGGRRPR